MVKAGRLLLLLNSPPTLSNCQPTVCCCLLWIGFNTYWKHWPPCVWLKNQNLSFEVIYLDLLPSFCICSLFSDCNLLQSQRYLSCNLAFLCVFMAVPVRLRVEGWEKAGEGTEEKKKGSEHVCESRSSNAPAKLTSLHLVMCGRQRERDTPWISNFIGAEKGGQAELGNLSRCLARNWCFWSESESGRTQIHTSS